MYPDLAGAGGVGGERAMVDFEDTSENGRAGVLVAMDTKRSKLLTGVTGGALRHKNWSVPVLDEAECLLALLGDQPLDSAAISARSVAQSGTNNTLPDGLQVKFRLHRFINSSKVQEGTKLPFIVTEDVAQNGNVLVPRGSPGWGSITGLDKAASYGREARLRFQVDSVRAVDGQEIRLRNSEQGTGKRTATQTAVAAAMSPVLGLWLKGKENGIRAGIVMVGYVDGERQVRTGAQ